METRQTKTEEAAATLADLAAGLPPGAWLPRRRHLREQHGWAYDTIARALSDLTAKGVIEHVPHRGHRVAGPPPLRRTSSDQTRVVNGWRGWHAVCMEAGKEPWTESTPRETPVPPHAASWLHVPIGTPVVERARTQGWVDGDRLVPVILSWTWIHPDVVRELPILRMPNTGPGGLTSRLEDAGHVVWWEEPVSARDAEPDEAIRLGIEPGTAVLDVWRRCWDQDGRVLEVTRRVINPKLHVLVYRYP